VDREIVLVSGTRASCFSGVRDNLGMAATGRAVDFRGMTWLTLKNGVIVEGWDSWNLGRLLESLR
jgi:hypothetical protein